MTIRGVSPMRLCNLYWIGHVVILIILSNFAIPSMPMDSTDITLEDVKKACDQLMKQGEAVFLQYRQMLTDKQWNFLIAVAKEGNVRQITASAFSIKTTN